MIQGSKGPSEPDACVTAGVRELMFHKPHPPLLSNKEHQSLAKKTHLYDHCYNDYPP